MEFADWDRDIASCVRRAASTRSVATCGRFRRYFVFKWSTADEPVLRVGWRATAAYRLRPDRPPAQAARGTCRAWRASRSAARRRTRSRSRSTEQLNAPGWSSTRWAAAGGQLLGLGDCWRTAVALQMQPMGGPTRRFRRCGWTTDEAATADVRLRPQRIDWPPPRQAHGRGLDIFKERRQSGRSLAQKLANRPGARRTGAGKRRHQVIRTWARRSPVRCWNWPRPAPSAWCCRSSCCTSSCGTGHRR